MKRSTLIALSALQVVSTVRGSGSPLTPRRKKRAAARGPKPLKAPSGGKNATNPETTTPEESFVANTTASTKRFTGPKTCARLALALLQGCVLAPRSCAYTFRSVVSSVKKKLGREGVILNEEGVGALFAGASTRAVYIAVLSSIQFFVYEYVKQVLHVSSYDLQLFFDVLSGLELSAGG